MAVIIKKLTIVLILFSFSLSALRAEPLKYVFTEYFPANYLDEEGNPAGFFVDIVYEALTNRLGIELSIQVLPWRRCQSLVANGEADLLTTIPTEERLSYAIQTVAPIWVKKYQIYTWYDHPDVEKMNTIKTIENIGDHSFVIISYLGNSWAQDKLLNKGLKVVFANTVDNMYRMLTARRGDLIIDDSILVDPALKRLGFENTIIKTSGIVEQSSFHILIGKKSSYIDIVDTVDMTLNDMWKDGTINLILEKYRNK